MQLNGPGLFWNEGPDTNLLHGLVVPYFTVTGSVGDLCLTTGGGWSKVLQFKLRMHCMTQEGWGVRIIIRRSHRHGVPHVSSWRIPGPISRCGAGALVAGQPGQSGQSREGAGLDYNTICQSPLPDNDSLARAAGIRLCREQSRIVWSRTSRAESWRFAREQSLYIE